MLTCLAMDEESNAGVPSMVSLLLVENVYIKVTHSNIMHSPFFVSIYTAVV